MGFVVDRVALGQVRLRGLWFSNVINPLNAELNPICHLLALLGPHHILHVSRIRVNFRISFPCLFVCRSRDGE